MTVENGCYPVRVFRSETPDGTYVDMNGAYPTIDDDHQLFGLKLTGNYKLPSLEQAYMATGHNSALIDDDGKMYLVYHTRFNDGGEGHSPRVHQMLVNADGWPCELPYQTQGETVSAGGYDTSETVGRYFVINQGTDISSDIANPRILYLNGDGSVVGRESVGTWSAQDGTYYMGITIDGETYQGVFCRMKDEAGTDVMTFSAVGANQSVWGDGESAMDNKLKYNEPWILQRADPYVYRHTDGTYYFTASVPEYDRIVLRSSDTLEELGSTPELEVWHKHESGPQSLHIWAPELHYLFGKWYIYYAGGDKDDIWAIRPYVLECQGDDPMRDPWVEKGKMTRAADDEFSFEAFSLDATVFEVNGNWYYIWAEKVGVGKQISNLYIAHMKNGYTLDTVQVMLTTPDYDWERYGFWVNEGPAVIRHDGKVFVTYSASDTGIHYCMGMLTADADSDLLDPLSWKKERYPVLTSSEEHMVYGPGHNSFTTDENGADIMVYHARTEREIIGNPLYNPNRHAMLMKIGWKDGRPVFSYDS